MMLGHSTDCMDDQKYSLQTLKDNVNLLFDAVRKTVETISDLCGKLGIPGWRQSAHQIDMLKKSFRICQKSKHSVSKDPQKQEYKMEKARMLHRDYINKAGDLLSRAEESIDMILQSDCGIKNLRCYSFFMTLMTSAAAHLVSCFLNNDTISL